MCLAIPGKVVSIDLSDPDMKILKSHPEGKEAAIIGKVTAEHQGIVGLQTNIGSSRIVDVISGEQLPRIC